MYDVKTANVQFYNICQFLHRNGTNTIHEMKCVPKHE